MPVIAVTLNQTEHSIGRAAIVCVAEQLLNTLAVGPKVRILFKSQADALQVTHKALPESRENLAQLKSQPMAELQVEQDHDVDAINTTAISQIEHAPIFFDKKLGVIIKPVYSRVNVLIQMKVWLPSESAAHRLRDDIRMHMSMRRECNLHTITYHYNLPFFITDLLNTVYALRESNQPYHETFNEWFESTASSNATVIATQGGVNTEIAFAETQNRIIGVFDFGDIPDKVEYDRENSRYGVSIPYKFSYDKVIACHARYPIIVHNQLLPSKFVLRNQPYRYEKTDSSASESIANFSYFDASEQKIMNINREGCLRFPHFDDFMPNQVLNGSVGIFSALCQIDPKNPRFLLNLRDLGDYSLDSDILDFLASSEYLFLNKTYRSPYQLTLYRDHLMLEDNLISVDKDLNVYSTVDLSERDVHRVRFSVVADFERVPLTDINRMKKHTTALLKTLACILNGVRQYGFYKDLSQVDRFFADTEVVNFIEFPSATTTNSIFKWTVEQIMLAGKIIDHPNFWYEMKRINTAPMGLAQTVMVNKIMTLRKD